jgi:hypothetical protein
LSEIKEELGDIEGDPLSAEEQAQLTEAETTYDEAREALDAAKAELKIAMGKDPSLSMLANERNPADDSDQ